MKTRILRRSLIAAGLLLAGAIAAPVAFARSHVSIGLGFSGPGYSVGYNNCGHCYYGYGAAYPAYYSDYYYPAYYEPAPAYYYDPYPVYGTVYYGGGGYYRGWRGHDNWRGRDARHWHGDRGDNHWHGH